LEKIITADYNNSTETRTGFYPWDWTVVMFTLAKYSVHPSI